MSKNYRIRIDQINGGWSEYTPQYGTPHGLFRTMKWVNILYDKSRNVISTSDSARHIFMTESEASDLITKHIDHINETTRKLSKGTTYKYIKILTH